MTTYSEKLTDPRWQKKRLEIFQRDGFKCRLCDDKNSTLHIHHLNYEKGKLPWEYDDNTLITLCESCHAMETELYPEYLEKFVGIIKRHFTSDNLLILMENIGELTGLYWDCEAHELGQIINNFDKNRKVN